MIVKVNVKEIVETVYRSGDLISETALLKRAEIGALIHREHQARYLEGERSEVYIEYADQVDGHEVVITGRIDGLIRVGGRIVIEEIKSTTWELDVLDENTVPAHLAQAKMYAYCYLKQNQLPDIAVRLTYVHVESKQVKILDFTYSEEELYDFYLVTLRLYIDWLEQIDRHEAEREKSLAGLQFPFPEYRAGQKDLIDAVYRNILNREILYAIAPTGVGKTIATLYPALKAINKKDQKVFYLTAKNLGKKVALDTVNLMMEKGLKCKVIEITAKETACFQKTKDCVAEKCPYARDYYGKLFAALRDIYCNEDMFIKEALAEYAEKHRLCPFEFSLDLSYYADIIICDYNYVFCPLTHLQRYFEVGAKYRPILLIDEAHNMPPRNRAMYSGIVAEKQVNLLRRLIGVAGEEYARACDELLARLDAYRRTISDEDYLVVPADWGFVEAVKQLVMVMSDALDEHRDLPRRSDIITLVFELIRFYTVADYFDENFVFALSNDKDEFAVKIDCLDAGKFVLRTIREMTLSSVFFSATLYPLTYYMKTLTEGEGNDVAIPSPFDTERLKVIVLPTISTRYRNREQSIEAIIDAIRVLAGSRPGNYITFFPSYAYMELVRAQLSAYNLDFSLIVQNPDFTPREREEVIELFRNNKETQVGLFVMGGMFSEGIDYLGDMLNGVIVIGVGLPHVGGYNDAAKEYYDQKLGQGFDFAYTYPGFAKVVQAVGRVIRSEEDYGVAILIDDRFAYRKYQSLFPEQWRNLTWVNDTFALSEELRSFWRRFAR